MTSIIQSILGIAVFISTALLFSEDRKKINYKLSITSFITLVLFAIFMLKVPAVTKVLLSVNKSLQSVAESSIKGSAVIFGDLASVEKNGFIMFIQNLPVLITVSALSSLLIHLRILPRIIQVLSKFFQAIFNISGTLGIAISANIFAGMAETPLVIRPYLKNIKRDELFSLMVCGASGMSSSVIILLGSIMGNAIPGGVTHIITSTLISIPTSLLISRIIIPKQKDTADKSIDILDLQKQESVAEAVFSGIVNGGKIVITIAVMLIGFISLIDVLNKILSLLPNVMGHEISIQAILGVMMSPAAWLIGIQDTEIFEVASIIGSKIAFNEVIAFQNFIEVSAKFSQKTQILVMYSIANFANIGSIGIILGVYNALVPERQREVMHLATKAVLSGVLVNFINAAIINILI